MSMPTPLLPPIPDNAHAYAAAQPLTGSGCIGQVHRATLKGSGKEVVRGVGCSDSTLAIHLLGCGKVRDVSS